MSFKLAFNSMDFAVITTGDHDYTTYEENGYHFIRFKEHCNAATLQSLFGATEDDLNRYGLTTHEDGRLRLMTIPEKNEFIRKYNKDHQDPIPEFNHDGTRKTIIKE